MKKRILAIVLLFVLALSSCGAQVNQSKNMSTALAAADAQKVLCVGRKGKILSNIPAGTSVCDWTATAYSLLDVKDDYDKYLSALEEYVSQKYQEEGKLDRAKATEWHRIALTVLALGGDPTAFGTDKNGKAVDLIADGTFNYINEDLGEQGINGYIYALVILDAGDFTVPDGSKYTKEMILDNILSAQNSDGGFGLVEGKSDADLTAMALQALAKYDDPKIRDAVETAVVYLSENQDGDGAYSGREGESAETCCQVIIALCTAGIDPRTDDRFIKHGTSIYDALLEFQIEDGSFVHDKNDIKGDPMSTEQAMLALAAVENFDKGIYGIFDFTE